MPKPSVPLSAAKAHLRIDHDLDDELIQNLIDAAVDRTLQEVGLAGALELPHVETLAADCHGRIKLSLPTVSVESVTRQGEETALDVEDYTLTGTLDGGHVVILTPAARAVSPWAGFEVSYTPGFGQHPPAWFRLAVLFLVGHYYENRSSVIIGQGVVAQEVPMGFTHLCRPHRRFFFV